MNNHCLEDQPSPDPLPLTPAERQELYSSWRQSLPSGARDFGHCALMRKGLR